MVYGVHWCECLLVPTSLTPRGDRAGDGRREWEKNGSRSSYTSFHVHTCTRSGEPSEYTCGALVAGSSTGSILPTKMIGGRGVARRTARRTARRQGGIQEMCVYYAGISWGGSAEAPPR